MSRVTIAAGSYASPAPFTEGLLGRAAARPRFRQQDIGPSLDSYIDVLEAKHPDARAHSTRVADLAVRLAERVYPDDCDLADSIPVAATYHDIGKIDVPDEILNKPGRLNAHEMKHIRRHPAVGAAILATYLDEPAVAMVRSHHERIDGMGYPDGLAGEAIPRGGRIIAVADAFDAIASTRAYRPACTKEEALDILRAGAGSQWDADVVAGLISLSEENLV